MPKTRPGSAEGLLLPLLLLKRDVKLPAN